MTSKDVDIQIQKMHADGWAAIKQGIAASRRLFMGSVFTDEQIAWHKNRRKPALTYNIALAHFKQHAGAQRQAKVQERVYPMKDGSIPVAAALTRILNSHANRGHLQTVHNKMADDTWIGGFGVSETFFNTLTDDPFGEVMTVAGNPLLHMFDLSAVAPDGGDVMDAVKESWLDRRALARALPEIEGREPALLDAAIRSSMKPARRGSSLDPTALLRGGAETSHHEFSIEEISGIDTYGTARFVEWYRRKIVPKRVFFDFVTQQNIDVTQFRDSDIAELVHYFRGQGGQPFVINKQALQMHLVVQLDKDIIVDDMVVEPNVLPWTYSLGYRIGHLLLGEGVSLIDPARAYSKVMSAFTEEVSKSANKGLVTIGDLDDEADAGTLQNLQEISQGLGGHANLPAGSDIKIVDYHSNNASMVNYASHMLEVMKQISASPDNSRGIGEGSHQSGVHAQQMIAQSMIGGEYLRENWLLARKALSDTVIKFVQHYDGAVPYRVFNFIDDGTGEQETVMFNQMLADSITNNLGVGGYSTTVEFQAYTVTERRARFKDVVDAVQAGGQNLPVEMLLRGAEVPDQDALVKMYYEGVAAQQQQMLLAAISGQSR